MDLFLVVVVLKRRCYYSNEATFGSEFAAIETYFPNPSELRDEQIHLLIERHPIGGREVPYAAMKHALRQLSHIQGLVYQKDWSEADSCLKAADGLLSTATRSA